MWLLLSLGADRLLHAQQLVDRLFPAGDGYAARLTVGRRAQLGDEMVYRSTIGGSSPVDGALTYGEYDLGHFCTLVERACADRPGGLEGATLLDCGSGCGRLVVAASALWPGLRRAVGIEKVAELHALGARAVAELPAEQQQRLTLRCGDAHDLPDEMRQACNTWAATVGTAM